MERFGRELRALREGLGLTRAALARDAGVSVSTVELVEIGARRIREQTLLRLVLALRPALPKLNSRHELKAPGDPEVRARYDADPAVFRRSTYEHLMAHVGFALAPPADEARLNRRLGSNSTANAG